MCRGSPPSLELALELIQVVLVLMIVVELVLMLLAELVPVPWLALKLVPKLALVPWLELVGPPMSPCHLSAAPAPEPRPAAKPKQHQMTKEMKLWVQYVGA